MPQPILCPTDHLRAPDAEPARKTVCLLSQGGSRPTLRFRWLLGVAEPILTA